MSMFSIVNMMPEGLEDAQRLTTTMMFLPLATHHLPILLVIAGMCSHVREVCEVPILLVSQ